MCIDLQRKKKRVSSRWDSTKQLHGKLWFKDPSFQTARTASQFLLNRLLILILVKYEPHFSEKFFHSVSFDLTTTCNMEGCALKNLLMEI